jgi:hypothetical protein
MHTHTFLQIKHNDIIVQYILPQHIYIAICIHYKTENLYKKKKVTVIHCMYCKKVKSNTLYVL